MQKDQCKFCIHAPVCAYKTKLEDIEKLYAPIKNKAAEYDVFVCEIKCRQYRKSEPVTISLKEVFDESP